MRVVLLFNARSGTGDAPKRVRHLAQALASDGHETISVDVRSAPDASSDALAAGADAAVIVGGDGSVHHALPALVRTCVPFWHAPLGTENLVARQFRHSRRSAPLRAALRAARTAEIDVGRCNGRLFLVMVSVGPDAGVVRRVAAARTGPITKLSYVLPTFREALDPSLGPIRAEADGVAFADAAPGIVVVANCRQYAARVDPCPDADIADGMLDAAFFPARSAAAALARLAAARLRFDAPGVRRARAKTITLAAPGLPAQVDGEAMTTDAASLRFEVLPAAARVLLPA